MLAGQTVSYTSVHTMCKLNHRCTRQSSRFSSRRTNHFSRKSNSVLLHFGYVALHGCGHPNSLMLSTIAHPLSPCVHVHGQWEAYAKHAIFYWWRPTPSTTFPGIRLGAKESRDLSRQCGLTNGLGYTIKIVWKIYGSPTWYFTWPSYKSLLRLCECCKFHC